MGEGRRWLLRHAKVWLGLIAAIWLGGLLFWLLDVRLPEWLL